MIAGILLAAGESTRMGQLKALLPWRGQTLLEAQIEALLRAQLDPIVVVLGHRADELRPLVPQHSAVRVALNPRYAEGRATSIVRGVQALAGDSPAGVVIASVDQPVDPDAVLAMEASHAETGASIVIPSTGQRRGHPVLLDRRLLPDLLDIAEERQGLREVVNRHEREIGYVVVDSPIIRLNLNAPEDYAAAYEQFGQPE